MLARATKPNSDTLPTIEPEPTPIMAAVASIKKPARLVAAESALRTARADRAAAAERLREIIAEKAKAPGDPTSAGFDRQIVAADAAIKAFDPLIAEKRAELAAARQAWHPAADRALAKPVADAVEAATALLDRLAAIAGDLREAGRFAEANGLGDAMAHAVRYSPHIVRAVADAKAALVRDF